jgi:hypothetical protein
VLLTFHLVLMAWVLFRTPSIQMVPSVYARLAQALTQGPGADLTTLLLPVILLYSVMLALDVGQLISAKNAFFPRMHGGLRSLIYVTAVFLMIFFAVKPYVPFFYFQF